VYDVGKVNGFVIDNVPLNVVGHVAPTVKDVVPESPIFTLPPLFDIIFTDPAADTVISLVKFVNCHCG
jgi:hypothetical protein